MTTMSIKTLLEVAPRLPVETSVLLRGDHGIGKSQVVRQIGRLIESNEKLMMPFIDQRLSQKTEGDMIGLPSTDGEVTRFNPPDWVKRACVEPCILFLDEINRATPEVMQAAFQLVLDRELNGWQLHPKTRVYSAINSSAAYTVNEMDPALLDRFWAIDLTPTHQDWLTWAEGSGNLASTIIDFHKSTDKWLDTPRGTEPGKVTTSRRSWERLSAALNNVGIAEQPDNGLFYPICLGYIGTEATIAFHSFVKTIDNQVSGEEVLSDYSKVKRKIAKLGQEKQNVVIEKVADYITKNLKSLDDNQGVNLKQFIDDLPGELRVSCWHKLMQGSGVENLDLARSIHKHCVQAVLSVFGVSTDAAKAALTNKPEEPKKTRKGSRA